MDLDWPGDWRLELDFHLHPADLKSLFLLEVIGRDSWNWLLECLLIVLNLGNLGMSVNHIYVVETSLL